MPKTGVWSSDKGEVKTRIMATQLLLNMYNAEEHKYSEEYKVKFKNFITKSQSSNLISNMIREARGRPGIPMSDDEFDRDQWVINCKNGIVVMMSQL